MSERKPLILFLIISIASNISAFKVYWNVPTERCLKFNLSFNLSKYNIIQNKGDKWDGNHVNIIYRPGMFPYYENGQAIWGGIPQRGDLTSHILRFEKQVQSEIPSDFDGVIILDSEDYQPLYDKSPYIYRKKSLEWAKEKYPNRSASRINQIARDTFNLMSKSFFQTLLDYGKYLRSSALWGYYHYPYCQNIPPKQRNCTDSQIKTNEEIKWLFEASSALYPSIYIYSKNFDSVLRSEQVQKRLENAMNLRKSSQKPIYPYFWYRYHDVDEYLEVADLWSTIGVIWKMNLEGVIIWGGYMDVESKDKCIKLKNYVDNILGPVIKIVTETSKRMQE